MYIDRKSKGFFEADIYTDFGVAMDVVGNGKAAMMYRVQYISLSYGC